MHNNYQISDSENFDKLMNEVFLYLDFNKSENEIILESVASSVLLPSTMQISNSKKSSGTGMSGKLWLKIIIVAVTLTVGISMVKLFFTESGNPESESVKKSSNSKAVQQEPLVEFISSMNKSKKEVFVQLSQPVMPEEKQKQLLLPAEDTLAAEVKMSNEEEPEILMIPEIHPKLGQDSVYVFPKLTEKEIRVNNKQKKKMIEQLIKFSKAKYVPIPMGTFKYNGEMVSLNGFYMQSAEVTNMEYRTFLFDLVIHESKEEFLKAKPDQQQWVKEYNKDFFKPLADNYFSGSAYNDCPVVNISREGAEMYCKWLSNEANKILKEKGKPLMNDVRIPVDIEWTYAASSGKSDLMYPWEKNVLRSKNNSGCFYANFCLKKYTGSLDSITISCNPQAHLNAYTTGGLMLGEGTFPVLVYAYNPNTYGLYCVSGNVAEMVYVSENKKPTRNVGTKGGSWDSSDEEIKINYPIQHIGRLTGAPFIGFRPVVSMSK